jgi:hypothetical protein
VYVLASESIRIETLAFRQHHELAPHEFSSEDIAAALRRCSHHAAVHFVLLWHRQIVTLMLEYQDQVLRSERAFKFDTICRMTMEGREGILMVSADSCRDMKKI